MEHFYAGERIIMRSPARRDIPSIVELADDKLVARYTNIPSPYSRKDAAFFLKRCKRERKEGSGLIFGVELKEESRLIGMIGLIHFNAKSRRAVLGYWFGRPYWGKGLGSESVGMALRFAFEKLDLTRVVAQVWHPNVASARVLEKCGFSLEGRLRKHIKKNGEWYDELVYGILRKEFEQYRNT